MKAEHIMDENIQAAEIAETLETPETFAEEVKPLPTFTADDISKARVQEKQKLYPQIDKLQEELSLLRKEREERIALEEARKAARLQRDAEREAEKKAKEEEEMTFKDLLKTKEQEWQSQLEQERQEREKAFALLDREREFQELQQYRQQRLEAERENIMPELIDMIAGNSKDEVEQSILRLKEKTAQIVDSVAAASQQTRKEMVGTRITAPASGPLDNNSDSRTYSPDDINNMSLADYAKNRAKLLGRGNNSGQGLFG
jgi:hypothetical protein